MLKDNVVSQTAISTNSSWGSSGVRAITNVNDTQYHCSFVVTPSPCFNNGDHKLPNAYKYEKIETIGPNGLMYDYYPSGGSESRGPLTRFYGNVANDGYTPEDNSNTVLNKALAKLYDKIRNSEVSLNTTIGEGRETLQMVKAVAITARTTLTSLKRIRKKILKGYIELEQNPLQTVGGAYLAWSVGLAPLLNDVENLRNHVANQLEPNMPFKVDGRSAMLRPVSKAYKFQGMQVDVTGTVLDQVEFGAVVTISDLHAFENWRLGLTARPTLVWELTTLSFVVDYFINIGQYLELLEASILNNGVSFVSGYKTTLKRHSTVYWIDQRLKGWGTNAWYGCNFSRKTTRTLKERTVLKSLPSPVRPTVKIPTAAGALLNCAALLAQLLRKSK